MVKVGILTYNTPISGPMDGKVTHFNQKAVKICDDKQKMIRNMMYLSFNANSHLAIAKKYGVIAKKDKDILNISYRFHVLTMQSHFDAAIMYLCKVFDTHYKSIDLIRVLDEIRNEGKCVIGGVNYFVYADGINLDVPAFQHRLCMVDDAAFINKLQKNERNIDASVLDVYAMDNIWNDEKTKITHISVALTFDEFIDWIDGKKDEYAEKLENLKERRNKYFAHNDKSFVLNDGPSIFENHPLLIGDISNLVKFSLSVSRFLMSAFLDENQLELPLDINDMDDTIAHTRRSFDQQNKYISDLESDVSLGD